MLYTESVKKQYDKYVVFNGVSFEIPSCSFVSLTGKNGIGKTTLLNIYNAPRCQDTKFIL